MTVPRPHGPSEEAPAPAQDDRPGRLTPGAVVYAVLSVAVIVVMIAYSGADQNRPATAEKAPGPAPAPTGPAPVPTAVAAEAPASVDDPAARAATDYAVAVSTYRSDEPASAYDQRLRPLVTAQEAVRAAAASPARRGKGPGRAVLSMSAVPVETVPLEGMPHAYLVTVKMTVSVDGRSSNQTVRYAVQTSRVGNRWAVSRAEPADRGVPLSFTGA